MNKTTEITGSEIASWMEGYLLPNRSAETTVGMAAAAASDYYAASATAPTPADCLKAWDKSKTATPRGKRLATYKWTEAC